MRVIACVLVLAGLMGGITAAQTDRRTMLLAEWTRVRAEVVARTPAAADLIDADKPAPMANTDEVEVSLVSAYITAYIVNVMPPPSGPRAPVRSTPGFPISEPATMLGGIDTALKWIATRREQLAARPSAMPFEEIQLAASEAFWSNYRQRVVNAIRARSQGAP